MTFALADKPPVAPGEQALLKKGERKRRASQVEGLEKLLYVDPKLLALSGGCLLIFVINTLVTPYNLSSESRSKETPANKYGFYAEATPEPPVNVRIADSGVTRREGTILPDSSGPGDTPAPKVDALANGILAYQQGDYGSAFRWWDEAYSRSPSETVTNNLAWLLATCPVDSYRNGPRSLELAKSLVNQGQFGPNLTVPWNRYGTLAAAYAETGRFREAVVSQELCLNRCPPEQRKIQSDRLELYRSKLPLRDVTRNVISTRKSTGNFATTGTSLSVETSR